MRQIRASGAFEDRDSPEPGAFARGRTETLALDDFEHCVLRVDVAAEVTAPQSRPQIEDAVRPAGKRDVGWVRERQQPPRLARRDRQQSLVVRVAADDAVQEHDVGGGDGVRVLRRIHDSTVDPGFEPMLAGEGAGLSLVRRRQLGVGRAGRAAFEQLELERPDAATDLEDLVALDPSRRDQVNEPPTRPTGAAPAIARGVAAGQLLVEELPVRGRRAAARHASNRTPLTRPVPCPAVSDYIFTMYRVDKFYGPERQVLSNISLSFLPGAKIGVLGPNGAGKSTVLRIMAGLEEPSSGVAELAPGASVGLLSQEPELDADKTVRENVEDGVREARDLWRAAGAR